jgi:hypothetical protein
MSFGPPVVDPLGSQPQVTIEVAGTDTMGVQPS